MHCVVISSLLSNVDCFKHLFTRLVYEQVSVVWQVGALTHSVAVKGVYPFEAPSITGKGLRVSQVITYIGKKTSFQSRIIHTCVHGET